MPDGSKWDVPISVIAEHRADYYRNEFDGSLERSLKEDTIPLFEDDEFEIVGFKEGVGNDKGTIVFKCITKEGVSFDCRPRGTVEYRKELFDDGENLIGKPLTVRYQGYGSQGAPRFGVGISIRDYE